MQEFQILCKVALWMVGVKTNILEAEDVFDSTQEAWDPQVLLQSECETTTGNWIFKEG